MVQKPKCCNHSFTAADTQGRLMTQKQAFGRHDPNLYGGNAERFARTTCPECEKTYLLWLKGERGTYRVLAISPLGEKSPDEMTTEELRAYLKSKQIPFFKGAPEDKLRELAKNA